MRYAYFAKARRLVIDIGGTVTVYDTLDHQIGGFSQQQSAGGTLSFNSQYGLIEVTSLPVISSNGRPPQPAVAPATNPPPAFSAAQATAGGRDTDIFASIERLAELHAKGVLNDNEFSANKAELLSRL